MYMSSKTEHAIGVEGVMVIRKLAAASIELLVLAVGAAMAAPYLLILVSPFILGR